MPASNHAVGRGSSSVEIIVDHWTIVMFEPLVWTKRVQQWLANLFGIGLREADISGPDVETGQTFDAKTASRC